MATITLPDGQDIKRMSQEQLIYWQLRLTKILSDRARFLDVQPKIDPNYRDFLSRTSAAFRGVIMMAAQEIQHRESLLDPTYDVRKHIGPVSSC